MTKPSVTEVSQQTDFEDQPCIVCRETKALERRGADVYECNNCHSLYKVTQKGGLKLTKTGRLPSPLQQTVRGMFSNLVGVTPDFMAASDHPYNCKCDICKEWWKSMGPDPDTMRCGSWEIEEIFDEEEAKEWRRRLEDDDASEGV